MEAVIPPDHPEFRERPAYRQTGTLHYFIGAYPSVALYKSLEI